jgi:hypothetical protein
MKMNMNMNSIKDFSKTFSMVDGGFIVFFVLFLVFPMEFPLSVNFFIDSALGMILLFVLTVVLFLYFNPLVGILFVIVAYELLRRASVGILSSDKVPVIEIPVSVVMVEGNEKFDKEPIAKKQATLEEEMVGSIPKPAEPSNSFTFSPVSQSSIGSSYI